MFKIGQHVWSRGEWSSIITEGIITNISEKQNHVKLKGISLPGSYGASITDIFVSKDAAASHYKQEDENQVNAYKQEILCNGTEYKTVTKNLIKFMLEHAVGLCDEYTNANARDAAIEIANEYLGVE